MSVAPDDRDYVAEMRRLGDSELLDWWLTETVRQFELKSAAIRDLHSRGQSRKVWEVLHGLSGAAGSGLGLLQTAARPLLEKYRHSDVPMTDDEVVGLLDAIAQQREELLKELGIGKPH